MPSTRRRRMRPRWQRRLGDVVRRHLLLLLLLLGISLGAVLGLSLRGVVSPSDEAAIRYLAFPGELLMRMLKLLILPLIVSSLVTAMCSLDAEATGKLGGRALVYYLVTTLVAMGIGMLLVYFIQPGAAAAGSSVGPPSTTAEPSAARGATSVIEPLLDLIRNMFPENLIEACFRSVSKILMVKKLDSEFATVKTVVSKVDGSMNILGLVVYSIVLGAMLVKLGPDGEPVAKFMHSLQDATMLMITLAIWYSPVGIMSLVAAELVKMPNPVESLRQLGLYLATVLLGLAIHGLLVLPLVYLFATRRNPLKFLAGTSQAMATAFGTSSSSATLPIAYKCLEENNKIDQRVTRFILPIGATVNMNGTALYEAVAPIFIAQLNGISLDFGQLIAIADRFRTMINVLGDCFGAGIVEHLSRRDLFASSTSSEETPQSAEPLLQQRRQSRSRLKSVDTEPLLEAIGDNSSSNI
uniref:Amino acid transporter n=1 Tax=Macrostomum lignano TaxID=282301 RepID=A0A1I8HU21_9PLAT